MNNGIEISSLQSHEEAEYERFLNECPRSLLYHSLEYRSLLNTILDARNTYLIARKEGDIVGALPVFIKMNEEYGGVANSLPFFGSNGGIICDERTPGDRRVRHALMSAFRDLCTEQDVVLSTIITSPFESDFDFYEENMDWDYKDERIGQLTPLDGLTERDDLEDELMGRFESVRRRNIRKARKEGVQLKRSTSPEDFAFLEQVHRDTMEAKGGRVKPHRFFEVVPDLFDAEEDYGLYVAKHEGDRIAALLVFFHNRVAEYFIPATKYEYRDLQPSALMIFEAMKDAIRKGCRWWNWGGTWRSQGGVYDFKKRWGTEDYPYEYFITAYDDVSHILHMSSEKIMEQYPHFYVVPFSELESE